MQDPSGPGIVQHLPDVVGTLIGTNLRARGKLLDLLRHCRTLPVSERRRLMILLDTKATLPPVLDATGPGRSNIYVGEIEALLPFIDAADGEPGRLVFGSRPRSRDELTTAHRLREHR
jgi:hypothetical protein